MLHVLRKLLLGGLGLLLLASSALLGLGWFTGALQGPQTALAHAALPYYRDASLQPRWDAWAAWQRMGEFTLVDQRAQLLGKAWLERAPTVVGFFYAGCASVCPISVALLRGVQESLGRQAAPQFLLISITPRDDSPQVLARYAQRMQLPANWLLATGEPRAVYAMAREHLLTELAEPVGNDQPLHANRAFLVDKQRRIRGVYDATSVVDMQRLRGDYLRLTREQGA